MLRNLMRKVLASCMVIVILASLTVPAFAVSPEIVASLVGTDFMSWVYDQFIDVAAPFVALFDKSTCSVNPNTDKRHNFEARHTTVDDKTGMYYICTYCGNSAGEVLEPAYSDYVQDLPATGYTSTGGLIWDTYSAFTGAGSYCAGHYEIMYSRWFNYWEDTESLPYTVKGEEDYKHPVLYRLDTANSAIVASTVKLPSYLFAGYEADILMPISGSYRHLPTLAYSYRCVSTEGKHRRGAVYVHHR